MFSFIYLFVIVHFGQKQKNKMVHCCVSGCAGRSETISHLPYSQDANHGRALETETETECLFRNFLHKNGVRIISFFNAEFNCEFKEAPCSSVIYVIIF